MGEIRGDMGEIWVRYGRDMEGRLLRGPDEEGRLLPMYISAISPLYLRYISAISPLQARRGLSGYQDTQDELEKVRVRVRARARV